MSLATAGERGPLLVPHIVVEHISEIDPELLLQMGKGHALIDLDNTLLAWGSEELEPSVVEWVKQALAAGMKICLLSNTKSYRVAYYAIQLGVPYVGVALKPSRQAARGAMRLLRCKAENTVIIGDQIFTDILLGRRLGLYTILCKPLAVREQFWMRLVRRLEKMFWPSQEETAAISTT
jgi:HAD superfamily phosphatase (TIGR01668 family)